MSLRNYIKSVWRAVTGKAVRSYRAVVGVGSAFSDWAWSFLSEDADLKNNISALRDRSRDLFKTNCYFIKYTEELWANVFGEDGIRLRMKVKEQEDRVVFAADEKGLLAAHTSKMERVRDFVNRKLGTLGVLAGFSFLSTGYDRGKATVQAGALDLYACRIIEERYREWQKAEFCTMAGNLTYNEVRQIRLLSCVRDGDFFIRMVRGAGVNKFGFSLQLINSEWCDFNLNIAKLENGNSIRMGVELNEWGRAVAFHFIKRTAWDWQMSTPGVSAGMGQIDHERIEAKDIIHYTRKKYADSTRGAPWIAAIIGKARQLDRFEEAEVIAARVGANKMGFITNTLAPEGGVTDEFQKSPCESKVQWHMDPGSIQGLEYGQEFKEWNPNHPAQNFESFRKGMLRSICAGLPAADYNVLGNDLEGINFSAGRLGKLDANEMWKLLQRFDIDTAERPIFEAWLEMALATRAIPLPLAKLEKFNKPHFTGRRWAGVDPIKETQAAVLAITNKLMSYSRWFDEQGQDLEEVWMEIAEEQMLAEELGIELPKPEGAQPEPTDEDEDDEDEPKKKPKEEARKHLNGNGHRPPALVP
jgi:lambda family phage portal protein